MPYRTPDVAAVSDSHGRPGRTDRAGLFAAFVPGAVATADGSITVDVTRYGERWIEYWVMVALTAVTPYVLYLVDQ
ncbi:hypothetical protein [Halobellus ruber]|uniref:Uncharacterized protein n=1 Tax=Halobellus ruber TaxID=2761102 RepID=A0A7J9SGA5_9EURY|nr:hypothetical protein [Halobellus ruber]MBB6645423.1 hypothetical protein [Halobellus ruber]